MESVLQEDDERLVQMVEEFIESSSSSSSCAAADGSFFSPSPSGDDHRSKYLAHIRDILEERETGAEAEVLESVKKHMRRRRRRMMRKGSSSSSSRDHRVTSGLKKWLVLGLQMEGHLASLCQTSWVTTIACPGGDYEYIDILIREDNGHSGNHRLIVDIDFKSQFEVARPTPTYEELTDTLPTVFVGSESKLNRIISILCSAAEESLRERGLHIPPWRTTTYMQSKWLSAAKCHLIGRGSSLPPSSLSSDSNHCGNYHTDKKKNDDDDDDDDDDNEGYSIRSKVLWAPPPPPAGNGGGVKGKRRSGSTLSSQFSDMSINCC